MYTTKMFHQFQSTEFNHDWFHTSYIKQFNNIEKACRNKDNSKLIQLLTGTHDNEEKAWKSIVSSLGGPNGLPMREQLIRLQRVTDYLFDQYKNNEVWQFATSLHAFEAIAKKTFWHDPSNIKVTKRKQLWKLIGKV
tara:strand:- start:910 stop:1320 length:411 start_codon:yes stop_codon:yes gene_type:complete